jgi:hypothetical protein
MLHLLQFKTSYMYIYGINYSLGLHNTLHYQLNYLEYYV